ncbi:hypothetical protein [Clostridium saudiense]|uniref:hypothetical protein n=1 Tax=Clostridium saudiense TaxID=1414720 RepID=UPI0008232EDF|nr:hypothetical protein [Clostridium saudiense]MDU7455131.1 hypothetical protein [Clostridium saudiense]MEE0725239.1 hypothetical protein [Clostridium saudiense]SCJ16956.1 Uncharacterised protein [uncultured Clostridium sp.]
MNRQMRYNEVKGIRVNLTTDDNDKVISLEDSWEYIKVEELQDLAKSNIALYINDAKEEDYILFNRSIVFEEIEVKKVRVRLLNGLTDTYNIQLILMR